VAEPFKHRLRVRYAECDPQGVLFNANYLAYIDHTITEMWRAAYGGYQEMLDRGVDIVVAEVTMRFLGSARFDEELELEAVVVRMGETSFTSNHRFRRSDGELLLDAQIRHVFIDPATGAKTRIPDWARAGMEPWHLSHMPPADPTTPPAASDAPTAPQNAPPAARKRPPAAPTTPPAAPHAPPAGTHTLGQPESWDF
jgi:acyl-CoA thioester hydrolase